MENLVQSFKEHLIQEEKSSITIEKYMRDVKKFLGFIGQNEVTKDVVIDYKKSLLESGYATRSVYSDRVNPFARTHCTTLTRK